MGDDDKGFTVYTIHPGSPSRSFKEYTFTKLLFKQGNLVIHNRGTIYFNSRLDIQGTDIYIFIYI